MNIVTSQAGFAPTIMIFDDDAAVVDIVARGILRDEQFGSLSARHAQAALRLLDDPAVRIDCIVADLSIMPEFRSDFGTIIDGIDLLQYAQAIRPGLKSVVLSMYSEEAAYRRKAEELEVEVLQWIEKSSGLTASGPRSIWKVLNDLFVSNALSSSPVSVDPSRLSFFVPEGERMDGVTVRVPFELIIYKDEGHYIADAASLGILQPGVGESAIEAVSDAKEVIASTYQMLENNTRFGNEESSAILAVLRKHLSGKSE